MSEFKTKAVRPSKSQIEKVSIDSLTPGGDGISKDLGVPLFVRRVAPGDVVDVEIFDRRKDFARGRVIQVVEASESRTEPYCKLFKVCGGCQWQHLKYEAQLEAKQDIVRQAIKHTGGLDPKLVKPPVAAQSPFYYRNKVQFPVAHPKDSDRILAGYYAQDSHDLVNVKHCPIQPEPLDRVLETTKIACERQKISAYSEKTHFGLLRHINARYSFSGNEALVTLVLNTEADKIDGSAKGKSHASLRLALEEIAKEIMAKVPEVVGVCANFNTNKGNTILGQETICLVGKPYIEETLKSRRTDLTEVQQAGLTFRLSATSFFQVNSAQAVKLLETIYDAIRLCLSESSSKHKVIVDAYAGVGTIALWISTLAEKIIALEDYPEAVRDGLINLEINRGIDNVEFREGQVEQTMLSIGREGIVPEVVIVDPPRKGLSSGAIEALRQLAPHHIVYVSCNPTTLARDIRLLKEPTLQHVPSGASIKGGFGYKTNEIQPVDLFPQTYHIESVTTLTRIAFDENIEA